MPSQLYPFNVYTYGVCLVFVYSLQWLWLDCELCANLGTFSNRGLVLVVLPGRLLVLAFAMQQGGDGEVGGGQVDETCRTRCRTVHIAVRMLPKKTLG